MDTGPARIVLPLTRKAWAFRLYAAFFLGVGAFLLFCAGQIALARGLLADILFVSLFSLAACVFGLMALLHSFVRIHFTPEGIALTLGKFTLRRLPAEQLRLVGLVQHRTRQGVVSQCVLSRRSLADLTALREKQLLQSPYMRTNVPYRKRQSGWQHTFAAEYLQKKGPLVFFGYMDPDLLWLEHLPELDAILDVLYGGRPMERVDFPLQNPSPTVPWTEPDPHHFCRGLCKPGERPVVQFLCLIFILSPLLLIAVPTSGLGIGILVFGLLSALFLVLWVLARDEYDIVHPETDGIRVTRSGRLLGTLPADQIRVILRIDMPITPYFHGLLAVTTQSPQEVVAREVSRLSRSRRGRQLLAAWQQLPGWEERLFIQACCRRITLEGFQSRRILLMANTPSRAQTLEELYPNAHRIHVDTMGRICP